MTTMQLTFFHALRKAGVPQEDARAVTEELVKEIDRRYSLHADQLATRGDLHEMRTDMHEMREDLISRIETVKTETIKWVLGAMVGLSGLVFAIARTMH